ncbi:MAG: hypothetical protein QNJ97_16865 [Myxococcota bacterium]|nr:hypothetical protein [Myxococcota bacterium]
MKRGFIYICFGFLMACGAEIGDECTLDYDCSQNLERNCDRSQPGGYCLIVGCDPDECPEEAVCVEFTAPCPQVNDDPNDDNPIDDCDLIEPNRGRSYCLRHCSSNGDCRSKYQCVTVGGEVPAVKWAEIVDFKTKKSKVCVPK